MKMTKTAEQDRLVQAEAEQDPTHGGTLHGDPTPVPKAVVGSTGQKPGSGICSS